MAMTTEATSKQDEGRPVSASVVLGILGPITLAGPRGEVRLGSGRQARLLAALAIDAPGEVRKSRLIERLWDADGDRAPVKAESALRTYVSRLRLAMARAGIEESRVVTTPNGYRLDVTDWFVDAEQFVALTRRAELADPHSAVGHLDRAFDLWRGDAYGSLGDLIWVLPERARLEELELASRELQIKYLSATGNNDEAIRQARAAITRNFYRDGLHEGLILALFPIRPNRRGPRGVPGLSKGTRRRAGPSSPVLASRSSTFACSTTTPTSWPGSSGDVGGYRFTSRLGTTAFGVVWHGQQRSLGRDVTILEIAPEVADDPRFIQRFTADIRTVAKLDHPHLVPVLDFWREPGAAYVVTKRTGGTTLESWADGRMSREDLARFCHQIGGALVAADLPRGLARRIEPTVDSRRRRRQFLAR